MTQTQYLMVEIRNLESDERSPILGTLADYKEQIQQVLKTQGVALDTLTLEHSPEGDYLIFNSHSTEQVNDSNKLTEHPIYLGIKPWLQSMGLESKYINAVLISIDDDERQSAETTDAQVNRAYLQEIQ